MRKGEHSQICKRNYSYSDNHRHDTVTKLKFDLFQNRDSINLFRPIHESNTNHTVFSTFTSLLTF